MLSAMYESLSLGGHRVPGFSLGIGNPASQKCIDSGGTLKTIDTPAGQQGVCVFPDGSQCEEWAFYRGECAPNGSKSKDVSPTAAAVMVGATAGLAVLVFKGPLWGAVTVFSGVALLTKIGIDSA